MNIRALVTVGAIAWSAFSTAAFAEEKLYRVGSRDVGWNNIDLTISELRREARTSHLSVPRYGNRTSVESRFAMCAFTDLTFQRGFAVWIVAHPAPDNDHVLLGFLNSDDEDPRTVLGDRFVGENVLAELKERYARVVPEARASLKYWIDTGEPRLKARKC